MPYDSHEQLIDEVALIQELAHRNLKIKGVENPTFNDVQEVVLTIQEAVASIDDNQLRIDILRETLLESSPLVEGHEHFKIDGKLEESLRIKAHIDPKPEFTAEQEETIKEAVAILRELASLDSKKFAQTEFALCGLGVARIYASVNDDVLGDGDERDELDDLMFTFMEAKRVVAEVCPCLGITPDSTVEDIDEELIDTVLERVEDLHESLKDGVLNNMN